CFIVRARLSFLCHVSPCRRHDAYAALTLTCILRIDTLAHSCMPRQHYPCAESNPRPRVACGESAGATMETESSFYWVWFAMFLSIPQSARDQQERTAEGGCATQMSFGFRPAKQKSRRFGILVGRTFLAFSNRVQISKSAQPSGCAEKTGAFSPPRFWAPAFKSTPIPQG